MKTAQIPLSRVFDECRDLLHLEFSNEEVDLDRPVRHSDIGRPGLLLAGFKAGKDRLRSIELSELGDVSGRSLLHLQCHFGLDTMAWARRGAIVTGVDFSPIAIDLARSLSEELDIPTEFVCSNIYDLERT